MGCFLLDPPTRSSRLRATRATTADGAASAPVASGSVDERVAATCALFPGLEMPCSTDGDLSRPVEKRKQRHENMTDVEVNLMVKAVTLPIAKSAPFPAADGGLEDGALTAGQRKKRTSAEKSAHTAEALRTVQAHFGDSAPYFPLGRPENRARKEKMAKAAIHFQVIGTVVVVQPEVRTPAVFTYSRGTMKEEHT